MAMGFKLDSITSSIRIESEEEILEVIAEVQRTIKGTEQAIY